MRQNLCILYICQCLILCLKYRSWTDSVNVQSIILHYFQISTWYVKIRISVLISLYIPITFLRNFFQQPTKSYNIRKCLTTLSIMSLRIMGPEQTVFTSPTSIEISAFSETHFQCHHLVKHLAPHIYQRCNSIANWNLCNKKHLTLPFICCLNQWCMEHCPPLKMTNPFLDLPTLRPALVKLCLSIILQNWRCPSCIHLHCCLLPAESA